MWLTDPLYGNVTILSLGIAVLIALIAFIVTRIVTLNIRRFGKEKLSMDQIKMLNKFINLGVAVVAVIIILPLVGIDPTGLMVAGGIIALVIGFASQSIVSNLISGLFLIVEKPMKIGDVVQIEGEVGVVENLGIMSTVIRTLDGVSVRVPNEKVFTNKVSNYVANKVRRFEYVIGIRYADDADKAVEIINSILAREPLILVNPASEVYVKELADNSVNIRVLMWAPSTEWWNLNKKLLYKMKTELENAGVQIPFPQRELWFNSEVEAKVKQG